MQVGNLTEINKRAGWNKGVQVGKFLKFNKICCTIIRDLKVVEIKNFALDIMIFEISLIQV